MKYLYGTFTSEQMKQQKESLHKAIFWLLLYKDPKTKDEYRFVDFEKYFKGVMLRLNGLNELLYNPPEIITLLSVLQAALIESRSNPFNYKTYRKLILDAHSLIDKIMECDKYA